MQTLQEGGLSTQPTPSDTEVLSRHIDHADFSQDQDSARSQVRASGQMSLREVFQQPTGARVATAPPGLDGVTSVAKDGEGRHLKMTTSDRIKKRSLRRALKRAERGETATYQGREIRLPDPSILPTERPETADFRQQQQRITAVHWNCSGLSQELQMEWFTWLRQDPSVAVFVRV